MLNNSNEIQFDGPPSILLVQQAVYSLYHDQNNINRENANNWLNKFQNTIYAWKIADDLLINKLDFESCYFGAQTLRTKIQLNFNELPSEAYISLKDSIINHLKNITAPQVQTQLALSITYLAILASSWQNPVEELISQDLNKLILIEIFTYLSEELDLSRKIRLKGVGANRRQQFSQYLCKIASKIINLLTTTLQETILIHQTEQSIQETNKNISGTTEKLIVKIYRCLGSWVNTIDSNEINLIEPLLAFIFESLRDPESSNTIHDAASDTICGTVLLCENYTKYQQLTHYLLNQIYLLEEVYQISVSIEDLDKSVNYSRIFTEMGESIVSPLIIEAIIESNSFNIPGLKIIDLLLHCIAHYDYEVAEITFHFWFRFTELIHKKGSNLVSFFSPFLSKLILGLTRHCQLESDKGGILKTSSSLFGFRQRVYDLVKEVIFIIDAVNYIEQDNIIGNMNKNLLDLCNKDLNITWEEVEAQFFIISCIVSDIKNNDNIILNIIDLILKTQGNDLHIQIFATCCNILGELFQWLEKNHDYLNPVLNYLISIITVNPQPTKEKSITLASISANALQRIFVNNSSKVLMSNVNLNNILIQICNQLDTISNEEVALCLLRSCSTIISTEFENESLETINEKENFIVRLLKPSVDNLNIGCNVATVPNKNFKIFIYLDRITSVFKNIRFKHALGETSIISQLCTQQIWPIIENILNQTVNVTNLKHDSLIEKCCRCLRSIIRFLKPNWLLKPIANTIVHLYQINPTYSTYLYLASILVDEFGVTQDPEINTGLITMLNTFCITTFQFLTTQNSDLKNYPNTIEDFFRLCNRYLQRNPEKFLIESMLESILNLTVASISLDHRDANNSVVRFLDDFLTKGRSDSSICDEVVRKMLVDKEFGQRLVQTVVMCAIINLPTHYLPDMSDIVWKMLNWDNKLMEKWLQVTIRYIITQDNLAVNASESAYLEEFYNDILRATNPKAVANSLRFISRILR